MKRRQLSQRKRTTVRVQKNVSVNFAETDKLFQEVATRERSIDYHSALYYLPNPDPVLKKKGLSIEVYDELLSDTYVSLCTERFMDGVKEKEWDIDRGKSKSTNAKIIKQIFTELADIGDGISGIIEATLKARLYGYQPIEVL